MIDTDRHWEAWGREDPYFGVLAEERFGRERLDAHRTEFFTSGEQQIVGVLGRYEREFGPLPRDRALDHGCGVGRLALPLSQAFSEVVAVDVSPSMLAEAESNASERGLTNLRFELADDQLSRAHRQFDFVNSFIVLQHIPVRRGLPILRRLIEKVRPGGGFQIQFSFRTDTGGPRLLYWASANIPGVKVWQNIAAGRRWNAPAMQMNNYPIASILAYLAQLGITRLLVETEYHPRFVACSLISKKPESGTGG